MGHQTVKCNRCRAVARVLATEGELFPKGNKPRVIVVIDCPNCGQREQPEVKEKQCQ